MSTPQAVESQKLEVEHHWVQTHRDLDLTAIEDIQADGYRQINLDGSVIDKDQPMASYAARGQGWEVAQSDEIAIQVHGNVAILIGRWTGRGEHQGERFDYQARFVAIYINDSAGWKLTFDQSTPID